MSIWDDVIAATRNTLETTASSSLNTKLSYAKDLIMSDNISTSVFDGTYFVRLKSVNQVDDSVNTRFVATYQVSVEVCHMIHPGDSVVSYNKSISDIETVIKYMCQYSTWSTYDKIQYIRINSIDEPKTVLKGEIYQITPIVFDVQIIINY